MAKLRDYPPCEGLEVALPDWDSAPCGVTAQSDPLTRANFDAMLDQFDQLDPHGNDWEIVTYKHWHTGNFEIVFVRPGSKVAQQAALIRTNLANFPCVDIDLWEKYEDEPKCQS